MMNRMEHDLMEFAASREVMEAEQGEDVAPDGGTEGHDVQEACVHAHGVPGVDDVVEPVGEAVGGSEMERDRTA